MFKFPYELPDARELVAKAGEILYAKLLPCHVEVIAADWDTKTPDQWGILAAFAMRVILQHVYQGFPLEMPAVVIDALLAAGKDLVTPLFECANCGYGLPRNFKRCPLCGGEVGLGAHGVRRSVKANLN